MYVAGEKLFNSCIQVFHQNGKFIRSLGNNLKNTTSIAATSDGHIVVACTEYTLNYQLSYSIKIFTSDGKEVHYENVSIGNIAVDDEGLIYVTDVNKKQILTL